MKYSILILALAALLTGCADAPLRDAPIEDRAARPIPSADAERATTRAVTPPPVDAQALAGAAPPPTRAEPGRVETRALQEPATEVKPLDPRAAERPAGLAAAPAARTPEQQRATVAQQLQTPGSLLARRLIHFDFDSAVIRDDYRSVLEAHAELLKANPAVKVILQGHADERGSREYNLALGQRRAESVLNALALLGVAHGQMEPVSMGEEKPLVEGQNEAAWQQNRRTEILYPGP